MKNFFAILSFFVGCTPAFAQFTAPVDSGYYFTRSETVTLANKLKFYKEKTQVADSLIPLMQRQISDFRSISEIKDKFIASLQKQVNYGRQNDSLYNEILKHTEQPNNLVRDLALVALLALTIVHIVK